MGKILPKLNFFGYLQDKEVVIVRTEGLVNAVVKGGCATGGRSFLVVDALIRTRSGPAMREKLIPTDTIYEISLNPISHLEAESEEEAQDEQNESPQPAKKERSKK